MSDDIPASEQSISLGGRLLLASPSLADGTFDHSVIMLCEHSATSGAHGIIINHPTGSTVGDLLKGTEFKPLAHLPVHQGGPLSAGELSFSAFSLSGKTGIRHRTHISIEAAALLVAKKDHIIRATIGHSAWSPGQLENELQRNTWITLRPTNELLAMRHDVSLWRTLLGGISPYHQLLSQAPQNPLLN